MQTETGKEYTLADLKGSFAIVMFGDSVTDHALQGLSKMEDITSEQGVKANVVDWPYKAQTAAIPTLVIVVQCN